MMQMNTHNLIRYKAENITFTSLLFAVPQFYRAIRAREQPFERCDISNAISAHQFDPHSTQINTLLWVMFDSTGNLENCQ